MVGGAAVAALLGPRLVRDEASGGITDSPPWPVLAQQGGVGAALGARAAKPEGKGEGRPPQRKSGKRLPRRPHDKSGLDERP
jgi:hypothetical protein